MDYLYPMDDMDDSDNDHVHYIYPLVMTNIAMVEI